MNPNSMGFGFSAAPIASTLTIGLPALAITNGSPATARATSSDNRVFASCMLTVSMAHSLNLAK